MSFNSSLFPTHCWLNELFIFQGIVTFRCTNKCISLITWEKHNSFCVVFIGNIVCTVHNNEIHQYRDYITELLFILFSNHFLLCIYLYVQIGVLNVEIEFKCANVPMLIRKKRISSFSENRPSFMVCHLIPFNRCFVWILYEYINWNSKAFHYVHKFYLLLYFPMSCIVYWIVLIRNVDVDFQIIFIVKKRRQEV